MTTSTLRGQSKTPSKWKVFRPLIAALLLIVCFGAARLHQNLSRNTRVFLRVTLEGEPAWQAELLCDEKPFSDGDNLPVGFHHLVVRHPKGRTVEQRFFLFYGRRDLDAIDLKRATGDLKLSFQPPVRTFTIQGDDFRTNVAGVSDFARTLPTGDYIFEAEYLHLTKRESVSVVEGRLTTVRIAPALGTLEIRGNQEGTTFDVVSEKHGSVASGSLPARIAEMPTGRYKVSARHAGHIRERNVTLENGQTTAVEMDFFYGAADFDTVPSGADVVSEDGRVLGKTPLALRQIEPGLKSIVFRLNSFEPVATAVEIKTDETNRVFKKLVRSAYAHAMREANDAISKRAFDRAIEALEQASQSEPNEPEPKTLLLAATRERSFIFAEDFAKQRNFSGAIRQMDLVLSTFPGDEKATRRREEYTRQNDAKLKADEEERSNQTKELFTSLVENIQDSELFEKHELETKMGLRYAQAAIMKALRADPPFVDIRADSTKGYAFKIEAEQQFMTALKTSAGKRKCVIIGAEIERGTTKLFYQVLEYKVEAVNKFSIGNLIGTPVAVNYLPIRPVQGAAADDKVQQRVQEGIRIVAERISTAIDAGK